MGTPLATKSKPHQYKNSNTAFSPIDTEPWPVGVKLCPDLVRLILVYEGSVVRAWQRDRIGMIYSKVYREFFGPRTGTQSLQNTTSEKLLPYYTAFATYILAKRPKVCRYSRYGRFHRIERQNKSRKFFRPWRGLAKKYKLHKAINQLAHKTEAPLIQYFDYASRRFQVRDVSRQLVQFGTTVTL